MRDYMFSGYDFSATLPLGLAFVSGHSGAIRICKFEFLLLIIVLFLR